MHMRQASGIARMAEEQISDSRGAGDGAVNAQACLMLVVTGRHRSGSRWPSNVVAFKRHTK